MSTKTTLRPTFETFAQEYARTGNQTAAYRAAYPDAQEGTVQGNANLLAKRPDIVARVEDLHGARRKALLEHASDLEGLIAELLAADPADLLDEAGDLKALRDIPPRLRQWLNVDITITTDAEGQAARKMRVTLPNKLDAKKFLAALQGRLVNRTDVTSGGRPLPPFTDPADLPATDAELRRRLLGESVDAEFTEVPPEPDGSDLL